MKASANTVTFLFLSIRKNKHIQKYSCSCNKCQKHKYENTTLLTNKSTTNKMVNVIC